MILPRLVQSVVLFLVLIILLAFVGQNYISAAIEKLSTPTPVVLWHGMGDSCCFSYGLGQVIKILEENIPGVYVKSVKIGNNMIEDVEHSYFKNVNDQVRQVCQEIAVDEKLKNGFHAIGFSQGSQFLRAVAQRCPDPPVINLISLGGQHQGVFGLPNCASLEHVLCNQLRQILHYAAYSSHIQENLVQAEYWHDPKREEIYKKSSVFLSDINNELRINESYRENLKRVKNFVMVKFDQDSMVEPRISEWFGFYKPGQDVVTQTLQESALYKEDRLGLKEMDEQGKLHFLSIDANHLQFSEKWFIDNIIKGFLTSK